MGVYSVRLWDGRRGWRTPGAVTRVPAEEGQGPIGRDWQELHVYGSMSDMAGIEGHGMTWTTGDGED